MANPESWCAEL